MKPAEQLLLMFEAVGGSIYTRTRVVKYAYFLGEMLGWEGLDFHPHYYGPYSECVAEALGELVSMGLIDETREDVESEAGGLERRRYKYEVTPAGHKVADIIGASLPSRESERLKATAQRLHEVARTVGYMTLACAAKTHFLLKASGGTMAPRDVEEKARESGWKVSEEEVVASAQLLVKLGLAQEVPPDSAAERLLEDLRE